MEKKLQKASHGRLLSEIVGVCGILPTLKLTLFFLQAHLQICI